MRDADDEDAATEAWAQVLQRAAKGAEARSYVTPFAPYKDDLVRFGREILGHRYWAGQEAVLRRVIEKRFVTLRKARKTGGTFAAADLALGFLVTRPSVVICLAPTDRQVRWNMFQKIRSAKARAKTELPGEAGIRSIQISEDWFMLGIATRDPENILGFHAGIELDDNDFEPELPDEDEDDQEPGDAPEPLAGTVFEFLKEHKAIAQMNDLLFIADEANGIEPPIFTGLSGSLSGDNVYMLMQANPLMSADAEHAYAQSFTNRDDQQWWRIHIGCDEPADDPVPSDECFHSIPERWLSRKWIEQRRQEWGENSPPFQAFCMGCFTTGIAEYQIIPLDLLKGASRFDLPDDEHVESRHIGADVAGAESGKGDWCVAVLTISGVVACVHKWQESDTMATIDKLLALSVEWGLPDRPIPASNIHIDATGLGKTMLDRIRQRGLPIDAIDFGGRPRYDWKHITGEAKFRDRKSELYWVQRRLLQEGLSIIPIKYQELWRQLQWQTWKPVARGGETVMGMRESKDEIRKRYGRSPDEADACVIALSRSSRRPTFRLVAPGSVVRP